MASSSSSSYSSVPVFDGEHYHIWAVKMKFFLRSQGLWNIVETDADPYPLRQNPTLAQIKAHEEEKCKKDKAITCLHSGVANHIFTKIMDLETPKQVWDKLQVEFEGSHRVLFEKHTSTEKKLVFFNIWRLLCLRFTVMYFLLLSLVSSPQDTIQTSNNQNASQYTLPVQSFSPKNC